MIGQISLEKLVIAIRNMATKEDALRLRKAICSVKSRISDEDFESLVKQFEAACKSIRG